MVSTLGLLLITLAGLPVGLPDACTPVRCSCLEPPAPRTALSAADAVFLGTVEVIRETTVLMDGADSGIPAREVTFRVHAAWKGLAAGTARVMVTTGHGAGDCGFEFETGTAYLVYGQQSDGKLSTSICTRTAAASDARADFDDLGQPPMVRHQ
ncbi:MAG: hypothetical protein H0U67_15175 [Gemmatimonadetes bacterium]|nr:hypothetical protein [Gemmatimonadota bacterium]